MIIADDPRPKEVSTPSEPEVPQQEEATDMRCDFCGDKVSSVRRVALDGDYDRLRKPHQVRYACPDCSQRKEQGRRADS